MIVIADIAGRYNELMKLVAKVPPGETIILVGDLIDRGSQSREVIEWAMKTPNVKTILGNHEDMLIDYYRGEGRYDHGLWITNGGFETLNSYGLNRNSTNEEVDDAIPEEHIEWLESLPLYIEESIYLISHAPFYAWDTIEEVKEKSKHYSERRRPDESGLLWNRSEPANRPGVIQVFGHNAQWGLRWFKDAADSSYAICIDDSWRKKLTALDTNTLEIYQEPYEV